VTGRIRSIEKFSDLIGKRTRDLPACNIAPQVTMPQCDKYNKLIELRFLLALNCFIIK
jgi:hypothetical protein